MVRSAANMAYYCVLLVALLAHDASVASFQSCCHPRTAVSFSANRKTPFYRNDRCVRIVLWSATSTTDGSEKRLEEEAPPLRSSDDEEELYGGEKRHRSNLTDEHSFLLSDEDSNVTEAVMVACSSEESALEAEVATSIQSRDIATSAAFSSETEAAFSKSLLTAQVLNASLLAITFGYAFYAILTIDHGMTRGWTPSEITMRIPLDNWASYESSLNSKPIATKTIINVVIYLLGDWLSQTFFQKKSMLDFDAMRTLRNGLIGLCFGPLVHEYYEISDHFLPVEVGINRLYKILMDQTLYLGVKCSIYIAAVSMLGGDDWKVAKDRVETRIGPIMVTAWKFWPLVHCVTYGVIPARHRILWVNSVDLVWNAILASKTSTDKVEDGLPLEEDLAAVADSQGATTSTPTTQR